MHTSTKTVDRHLKKLVAGGWLKKATRYSGEKQTSNLYELMLVEGKRRGDKLSPIEKEGRQIVHLGGTKTTHRTKPLTNKKNLRKMAGELRAMGII